MKRLTNEQFIEKAKCVHGNNYDYSKCIYINNCTKVEIICNNCNNSFYQQPNNHLFKQGCPNCFGKNKFTNKLFIEKSIKVHGDKYDYSLSNYINNHTKVKIICKTCNSIFEQVPVSHINNKNGCGVCAAKQNGINLRKSQDQFIIEAKAIHGDRYDYSLVNYIDINKKIILKCNKCKTWFKQIANNHLRNRGCLRCSVGISKPETEWLDSLNILKENRQVYIKIDNSKYFVDAYNKETNTVYEFYGDFWHGNPNKYNPSKLNKKVGKTFGELYNKVLIKENKLISAGYNVISMWESDWNKIKSGK